MINLIRADIYRVVRGKALYITLAVLLVYCVLTVGSIHALQSGVITITMQDSAIADTHEDFLNMLEGPGVSGVTIPRDTAAQMDNFVFFLLPIIVVVAGAIFSHGTVKNDIAWGVSRTKLYFSKLILCSILCILFLKLYIGFNMAVATVINGFGGPAPAGHWVGLFQIFSAQLVILLSFVSVGVFLAFTTKRVAAVNGAFIAYVFVPLFLLTIITIINTNLEWLLDFEMISNLMNLARWPYLETREILRALGLGAFLLIGSTLGGVALFRRAEIK